uniref:WAP domain-containing protein n=2 Tax=Canis lupus familiaris TaxID=9615 RepID=A0A8C0P0H9_CANLF
MMKGAVFVLVAFITVGMELKPLYVAEQERPSICPEVPKEFSGICAELCLGGLSCRKGMKCCSNGCGHVYKYLVPQLSINQSRAVQGDGQLPSGLCWGRQMLTCPSHTDVWITPRERG